ncbi:MAG TPA: hypothetical protein VFX48_04675, partial [Saprospiraceae bacterium]|nr:hypothetical protein [Saprospiraceae bacterium]
ESVLVFLFCFMTLWNLAFHVLVYFPLQDSPDVQSYLGLARMEWDQNPVRQYRVIIPLLASGLDHLSAWAIDRLQPWSFEGDFSLCFSFLMVNTFIMSVVLWLIYRICRSFDAPRWACALAVLAVLSSRWTAELAGLPLVDSLYLLTLTAALFAMQTGNRAFWIFSILMGPWAKEAYVFMVPLLLYYSPVKKRETLLWLLVSGILVFSFRFAHDWMLGISWGNSFAESFDSWNTISSSLFRLFSFHGVYELFSVVGYWSFIPLIAFWNSSKPVREKLGAIPAYGYAYLLVVLIQALLSSDLSRMFFLSAPVVAVAIAISLHRLHSKYAAIKAEGISK